MGPTGHTIQLCEQCGIKFILVEKEEQAMKYKNSLRKLSDRIVDYQKTTDKLSEDQRRAFRRPGSQNRKKN